MFSAIPFLLANAGKVQRAYPERAQGKSTECHEFQDFSGSFHGVFRVFSGYFWGVSCVFQGVFGVLFPKGSLRTLKTLTSLKKDVRQFFLGDKGVWSFPLCFFPKRLQHFLAWPSLQSLAVKKIFYFLKILGGEKLLKFGWKMGGEKFLGGLRGLKNFSNAFRIVFRVLFRVFQTVFRIKLKMFRGQFRSAGVPP